MPPTRGPYGSKDEIALFFREQKRLKDDNDDDDFEDYFHRVKTRRRSENSSAVSSGMDVDVRMDELSPSPLLPLTPPSAILPNANNKRKRSPERTIASAVAQDAATPHITHSAIPSCTSMEIPVIPLTSPRRIHNPRKAPTSSKMASKTIPQVVPSDIDMDEQIDYTADPNAVSRPPHRSTKPLSSRTTRSIAATPIVAKASCTSPTKPISSSRSDAEKPLPAPLPSQDTSDIEDISEFPDTSHFAPLATSTQKDTASPRKRTKTSSSSASAKHTLAKARPKVVKLPMKPVAETSQWAPPVASGSSAVGEKTSIIESSPGPSSPELVKLSFQREARPVQTRKTLDMQAQQKPKPAKQATEMRIVSSKSVWKLPVGPPPPKSEDAGMTPPQYAAWTTKKFAESEKAKKVKKIDKVIFLVSGDGSTATTGTKSKMDKIVEWGATLQSKFDPATATHILVPKTVPDKSRAAKELGVKSILHVPKHIPIFKWDWFPLHGRKNGEGNGPESYDFPAYVDTFNNGVPEWQNTAASASTNSRRNLKGKRKAADSSEDEHESEEVTPPELSIAAPTPQPSPHAKQPALPSTDPLAEFYGNARAALALDIDDSDFEEEIEGDAAEAALVQSKKAKGWACDNKVSSRIINNPNQSIIDILRELSGLHDAQRGDDHKWRVLGYRKAIDSLTRYPKRITSFEEAKKLRGVGEKTALKIMEIINTGDLQRLKYENNEEVQCMKIFRGIYGVGSSIAQQWYAAGVRTLNDVRTRKGGIKLNKGQLIGLRYYDELADRMPRREAQRFFELIQPIALKIDPKLYVNIMGSFRRGKADCGDIDILITRDDSDGKTHSGVLSRLMADLYDADILTEDLSVPDDLDALEATYHGLCHLPHTPKSFRRRIDFLCVPWASRGSALIYYTGDDIFNRSMRLKANKMGYSLNQRGLYEGVVRDPHDRTKKTNAGTIIASRTEEEIFEKLGVPWQEPHERVRHFE